MKKKNLGFWEEKNQCGAIGYLYGNNKSGPLLHPIKIFLFETDHKPKYKILNIKLCEKLEKYFHKLKYINISWIGHKKH